MYEIALKILAAVAGSDPGTIRWIDPYCRCAQLLVDSLALCPESHTQEEIDRMRAGINQLLSFGFLVPEGDHYRVTMAGRTFVKITKLMDQEE